jgi:hypothetical protein
MVWEEPSSRTYHFLSDKDYGPRGVYMCEKAARDKVSAPPGRRSPRTEPHRVKRASLRALAGWDREILAIELQGLVDLGFEVEVTGFSIPDIDVVLDEAAEVQGGPPGREDEMPDTPGVVVSRAGDLWALGDHRLLCRPARRARQAPDGQAGRHGGGCHHGLLPPQGNCPRCLHGLGDYFDRRRAHRTQGAR